MSASVKMEIDFPFALDQVLEENEVAVLTELGEKSINLAERIWVGWKYGTHYPPEQMGTSFRSWQWAMMTEAEAGKFARGINILNEASVQARQGTYEPKYWGRPSGVKKPYANRQVGNKYAAYVTRSGSTTPEYERVKSQIVSDLVPQATRNLKNAIISNMSKNRQKVTLRLDKAGGGHDFNILTQTTI